MQYATPGLPSRKRHLLSVSYSTIPCSDFQIMLLLVNVFKLWSCWLFFNYQCVICLSCELSTPKLGSHTSPQRQAVTALEPLTTVKALSSTFLLRQQGEHAPGLSMSSSSSSSRALTSPLACARTGGSSKACATVLGRGRRKRGQ